MHFETLIYFACSFSVISSNERPLVSGINFQTKISENTPTMAYMKNTPLVPSKPTRPKNVNEIMKLEAQLATVATLIALPLILSG